MTFFRHFLIALVVACLLTGHAEFAQSRIVLPRVRPEAVGISSEKLQKLDAFLERMIDEKEFAGMVTMAARRGKVFHSKAFGMRDIASGSPMTEDTIFRIFSMSKPVTAVAMMILYEEGKWKLDDPIAKHILEFANLKVFKGVDSSGKILLEEPSHPPTMRELMTHTAGFTYGFGNTPVERLYQDETGRNAVLGAASFREMIDRLAKIPLLYQPGTRWNYSLSVDLQGYLVEKLSGKPFHEFLKERMFDPLVMIDTGFYVPEAKLGRFVTYYKKETNGELVEKPTGLNDRNYDRMPGLPTGGGGLVSTVSDYLHFAQMLLNGGKFGGKRILRSKTVAMMTRNHLPTALPTGRVVPRPGIGFGFGFAIVTDPKVAISALGNGTFYWDGAAGTWFWIDPTNNLIFVGMVQRLDNNNRPELSKLMPPLIYQALIDMKQ
jgi:CubicO group peptidase (beta-lactamase class C family)